MSRERRLTAGAVAVLLVALLGVAAGPGVLADPAADGPVRPGPVAIAESPAIAPGEVDGATATLTLHTRIGHRGNPTDNVSVRFRAYDAESGLLTTERTVDLDELTGDRSVAVNATIEVPREGGYVIETVVFREGEVVDRDRTQVSGLEALGTEVRFTESEAVPPLSVSVASVDEGANRTTLAVAASLTNGGAVSSEDLRVEVILRQAESNLVAARQSTTVADIGPGRTADATTEVSVPSDYNYYVDAAVYRDGVLVDTARSVANLDPTETISANETTREVEFEVGDFAGGDDGAGDRMTEAAEGTETSTATPGFGPALAVVALAGAALLARRRTRR
ncbi:PGF-CTERM sorting domain-containing protein [Halobaculum sp. WSA2]|uniref:PGF-CTERM sorting domain-containing protein n=1 Tax=Halobaculum saliterrae TaxID=2073113 RepID=A0A6B0SXK0_9EURY|nr:PGF-CTERM sorting domain-containing protein [Halobaculum saliterrae]MXR41351.1 PGF-CTERM sorting domain-containing protein [Halobaculum saliterrae]